MNPDRSCATCQHAGPADQPSLRLCRQSPPLWRASDGYATWPTVLPDDWCSLYWGPGPTFTATIGRHRVEAVRSEFAEAYPLGHPQHDEAQSVGFMLDQVAVTIANRLEQPE